MLQHATLFQEIDDLHTIYGNPNFFPIYGAGQIEHPKICLVFMNPTARNVSALSTWKSLRAPWLGTKHVWKMLHTLGLFKNDKILEEIFKMRPAEWTELFAEKLYTEIANELVYITNIAKCTQEDARSLPNNLFRAYLPSIIRELELVKPEKVITFGNQVSSILLQKPISVSNYSNSTDVEVLKTPSGATFQVYPTYYPVGQGMRNMGKAIARISALL